MSATERRQRLVRACLLGGGAAISLGSVWDVSWDASIGVHSFSSPPHIAINLGGVAIAVAGLLLCRHRPIPAILALLGAAAMAAAEAVGLAHGTPPVAVDAWTPLHLVAVAGMATAVFAGIAHAAELDGRAGRIDRALATGLLLVFAATALGAYSLPNLQRTALFHQVSAAVYPGVLALALAANAGRWSATAAALVYLLAITLLVWILPWFPATPATGPVYQPLQHLLPPRFPLLLIAPAVGFDLARRALAEQPWLRTPLLAAVYCATFIPAQWYFSAFLLSPASAGWLFAGGGEYWPFFVEIGSERMMFWGMEESPLDGGALAWTFAYALASAASGQALGTLLRHGRVFSAPRP